MCERPFRSALWILGDLAFRSSGRCQMRDLPNALARALYDYFADHLPRLRDMSPHTVCSYRDSLALFLRFVASRGPRSVSELDLDHLGPQEVISFLHYLKEDRHNTPSTSNVRLAA